ncbi:hypothetical protein BZA70DRAFT_264923 [Myxozyma melibiosi]|uniref:Hikeshi-like domain-containing protein n=1 Tax=Myxozyma melibiosi TaxID=54550 RepID=A0ABR1FCI6_9ASCO
MFGAICAGRPVQTNLQQIDPTKFVFQIEDGASVNHIVVFLLPGTVLDPSVAATVYFQWPGKPFQLLGAISNNKPSAIFKVNQRTPAPRVTASIDDMVDDDTDLVSAGAEPITISLGISIEPADQVEAQISQMRANSAGSSTALVPSSKRAPLNPNSTAALANKIVSNAFNFLSGFATPDGMVPLKTFNDWWTKFQNKLAVDPQFIHRIEED